MAEEAFDEADWRDRISAHRAEKDEFFRSGEASPIPATERDTFEGLSYFPLDPDFRFEARFVRSDRPEAVTLPANRGPDVEIERVGTVGFTVDGAHETLAVYRSNGVNDCLVPFGDETNGESTWEGGRYLTLDVGAVETDDTVVVLDFNLAYHPFCVFDDEYVAVRAPPENQLSVAIRAGERI